ncbi:hypothetical protein PYCC9005_003955 [Savitreella phatthalungensis]
MDSLFLKRNNAVAVNGGQAQGVDGINEAGSDWYWAVFAVMAFSMLVFSGMTLRIPRGERIFHYITILIVAVASIAYYTMASNLGSAAVAIEFANYSSDPYRQVFYARYIDWFVTTPLLLLDLLLLAGLEWSQIIFVVVMDEIMVVTGLVGALTPSSYKWGYWTFGMVAYFLVAYVLIFEARKNALRIGSDVHRVYIGVAVWTAFLWTLYPVAWGLSEGGNVTSSDGEAVFYGVLDILAKPVFGLWILLGHRGIGLDRLGLVEGRTYLGNGVTGSGREKDVVLGSDHHRNNSTGVAAPAAHTAGAAPAHTTGAAPINGTTAPVTQV